MSAAPELAPWQRSHIASAARRRRPVGVTARAMDLPPAVVVLANKDLTKARRERAKKALARTNKVASETIRTAPNTLADGAFRLSVDVPWQILKAIHDAAYRRGKTSDELATELLTAIVDDNLFKAVLDTGRKR